MDLSLWLIGKVLKEQLLVARLQTSLHFNLSLQSHKTTCTNKWTFVNVVFPIILLLHSSTVYSTGKLKWTWGHAQLLYIHTRTHVMHKRHTDNMYMQFSRSLRIMIIWVNEDLVTCTGVHTEHIYHLQQGESINKQQQHLL